MIRERMDFADPYESSRTEQTYGSVRSYFYKSSMAAGMDFRKKEDPFQLIRRAGVHV